MVKKRAFRWTGVDKVMLPLTLAMAVLWALVKFI